MIKNSYLYLKLFLIFSFFITISLGFFAHPVLAGTCPGSSIIGVIQTGPYDPPCSDGSGTAVGCPSGYSCCAVDYEGVYEGGWLNDDWHVTQIFQDVYGEEKTVCANLSTSTLLSVSGEVLQNEYNWTQITNESTRNVVISPCWGSPSIVPWNPSIHVGLDISDCQPGESIIGYEHGSYSYDSYCAVNHSGTSSITGEGSCCSFDRDNSNVCNYPRNPAGSGTPTTSVTCCAARLPTQEQCIFAGEASQGQCGQCPGGGSVTPDPNPSPVACGVPLPAADATPCCDSTEPYLTCRPVMRNGGGGCVNDPPLHACADLAAVGQICWRDDQCGSGICDFVSASTSYKTCLAKPVNTQCVHSCQCATGLECLAATEGGRTCQPAGGCLPANSPNCEVGVDCCMPNGTQLQECTPAAPGDAMGSCMNTGESCVPTGQACTPGQECCPSNTGTVYTCNPLVPTPPPPAPSHACAPAAADCKAHGAACIIGTDCCQDAADVCMGSPNATCTTSTGGSACTGNSCSDCPPGFGCDAGNCVLKPECDLTLDVIPYSGPIIGFHDLLSRLYVFFYPIGLLFGSAFIIKAGYTLMTSEGDPAKVKEGQEELTAAIIGTVFIMLSIAILRVIIKALLGASL